jgi:hypothetical protein
VNALCAALKRFSHGSADRAAVRSLGAMNCISRVVGRHNMTWCACVRAFPCRLRRTLRSSDVRSSHSGTRSRC